MAIVDNLEAGLGAARRGASLIQLRAPGLPARDLQELAGRLVAGSDLPVVVSRRADVAAVVGAAGVNLPEDDLPVAAARRLLGPGALIGRSVHGLAGALEAEAAGASYLLFGPIYATPSHPRERPVGLRALSAIAAAVTIPVLGVGGIDGASVGAILEAGAGGHAAIRLYA